MLKKNGFYFSYSKEENIKIDDNRLLEFTHLLLEQKGKYFYESEHFQQTHDILDTINCFSSIGVEYRSIFPVKIKTRPCIVILRRKANVLPSQEIPLQIVSDDIVHKIDSIEQQTKAVYDASKPKDEQANGNEHNSITTDLIDDEYNESEYNEPNELPNTDDFDEEEDNDNIIGIDLRKPSKETKFKLGKLIERHYRTKNSAAL